MFDWNDLRFFLELQRSGRLLSAAKRLNTTHSTVARHIENIEKAWVRHCSSSMPRAMN